ncbi:MAG: DUF4097 domain-containing protein [Candidatus Korobacteraceae bacterium]
MNPQRIAPLAGALLLCTFLVFVQEVSAQDVAEGSFTRNLKVSGPVNLQVRAGSGSITVRRGSSGEVQVMARIRANRGLFSTGDPAERVRAVENNPPIEQNGSSIRIGFVQDNDIYRNISISYEILTPAQTELSARSGSGSVSVEGIQGTVDAHTGSGSIRILDVDRDVRTSAGSGAIELDGLRNSVTARTGSGPIRATHLGRLSAVSGATNEQPTARLDLQTGSGSIRLNDIVGSLRASTGSGSIHAAGEPEGSWHLRTGSGGVILDLPQNSGFDLVARTGSGGIRVDHPLTTEGRMEKNSVRGTVRGGGASLDIHTGSGGIRIQ